MIKKSWTADTPFTVTVPAIGTVRKWYRSAHAYMLSKVLNVSALYDCTPLDSCARFILRLADDEDEFGGCHSREPSHLPLHWLALKAGLSKPH